ncbi:LysR family transcriptional regulator [Streptomyces sp. NPDC058676]|uniref:LysR family transcriptional regulator n=1 Tax=unclassified Streptomyces TaxID=2593676 RepID=UPI00365F771A
MTAGGEMVATTRAGAVPAADPSIRQLRLFLALSEELHFGRAAARLYITQPALSQQIRDLEVRLGVRLFTRSSRAVDLTVAGRALLPDVRATVEAADRIRRTADAQTRQLSGRLIVGSIGAEAAMPHTRAVLQALHESHPGITVQLLSLNFVEHIAALVRQEVDVVFLRPPVPEGIDLRHLATEPRVACLPADDRLADLPHVTLAQLAGYPVVAMPDEVPRVWWDFWAVDPRPDGSPVRYGPVATDMESLFHIVAGGEAICFLPAAARELFPRPSIRYVDVTDLTPSTSALAWLSTRQSEPGIAAIRQAADRAVC